MQISFRSWLRPVVQAAVCLIVATSFAQTPVVRTTVAKPVVPAVCKDCGGDMKCGAQCRECAMKTHLKMTVPADMRAGSFVYTLDNDTKSNGVAVYRRNADGTLNPLSGSPFAAGGRGLTGGDIDEQGAVRVHGEFVLAVNPGSDSIAVFKKSDAGLLHVPGSPFPSGGSTPLSLTIHKDLVYVANQAAPFAKPTSEPCLVGFRLGSDGRLTPIPGSRVKFAEGQGPAQVEFASHGRTLAVSAGFQTEEGGRIFTYKVLNDGRLEAGVGSPIKPDGAAGTVGFSWNPTGDTVFASLFKGSAVIPFMVDPQTAAVTQVGPALSDAQQAACWTAITRDGKTLYVGNFVSNSISVFDVAGGKLTLLGSVPRRGATEKDTKDIELSPDGKHLYAIGSGARQISIFKIESNRLLTELPAGMSPLTIPTGENTTGLAIE